MPRFTISLDDRLAARFDQWLAERGYENRSEAVRDLLRAEFGRAQLEHGDQPCVASLSYVFNHHQRDLAERLTALQHAHHDLSIATLHAHLDHEHCLESAILRGPADRVARFAEQLCAERGVHHGRLNLISVEAHEPHASHGHGAHEDGRASHETPPHLHLKPSA